MSAKVLTVLALVAAALASANAAGDGARPVAHPRGGLWLVLPPGWTGAADEVAGRLDLGSASRAAKVSVVAFPLARRDDEIFDAVRDRFAHLTRAGAPADIAWETSALALPRLEHFETAGRGARFLLDGHPLRLEVHLLRGARSVFAFAVTADADAWPREREAFLALLRSARPTEAGARAGTESTVALLDSLVQLPGRDLRFSVPRGTEAETEGPRLLLRLPATGGTFVALFRETPLEPAAFLQSFREQYSVQGATLAWEAGGPFRASDGSRAGARGLVAVTLAREGKAPVAVEQRIYVLPAHPASRAGSAPGVIFVTASGEARAGEGALFDAIAASAAGTGEPR